MKARVIEMVIGALGTVTPKLKQWLQQTPEIRSLFRRAQGTVKILPSIPP